MRPLSLALLPAVVLVAQAPSVSLVKRFNDELPGIKQLQKSLQAKEAMAKAEAILPAQPPAFNGANLQTIGESLDQAQGMLSLYNLAATTSAEAGEWEKALAYQEKRLQAAQTTREELLKAQQVIQVMWDKAVKDSQDYIAANGTRQLDLEAKVKKVQEDIAAVNAKTKKFTPDEIKDLKTRADAAPKDEQEAAVIAANIKVFKENQEKAKKVGKYLADNQAEADKMVKAAQDSLAKVKGVNAVQSDEITKFNTDQMIKKVKIVGKKNWVDAVMKNHANVTSLATPQDQSIFLNRMLVLDPGNALAEKALANIKQGKEPFSKEVKPGKKGASGKK
jgi:hypothetical protein